MNHVDLDFFCKLLRERSGLVLTEEKGYLLESRLLPVARRRGLKTVEEVAQALRGKPDPILLREVVEAMTTNESFFFRDNKPFEQFRTVVLPRLLKARVGSRQLRIWSAACSSGQEPYSLAMILAEEQAKLLGWKVEIIATDLSSEMIERSRAGLYTQFEVQRGLPIHFLIKYFVKDGDRWRIKPPLGEAIQFRLFNLLEDPVALGRFDVIFCRNVLIYFDQPTKSRILGRMAQRLQPDGYLFLGGAETVLGICDRFATLTDHRGLYQPVSELAAAK